MHTEIKPDYHIKEKRKYTAAFVLFFLLTIQAGRVLYNFSANETWKNILAIAGGLVCATIACLAFVKCRKLEKNKDKKIH